MSKTQTLTGAQIVVTALEDEGVAFCFGIPGTHNIELYDQLAESKAIQTILVTDEQSASFMADGVWRASAKLACVNVVPGAGLTHAMSGIAEAFMDQIPLLVLACGIRRESGKSFQLHDVDQMAMVKPVTKGVFRPETLSDIYPMIRRAGAVARQAPQGPVMVEISVDHYFNRGPVTFNFVEATAPLREETQEIQAAAEILNRARKPLIYVGHGCLEARDLLLPLAETLNAPVATTLQGKGIFPENHPLFFWNGFGASAPKALQAEIEDCDACLAIGCRFGEIATGSYGATPPQPLIHVDIDPNVLGRNIAPQLAIQSDARLFLTALLPRLSVKSNAAVQSALQTAHGEVARAWDKETSTSGVGPARLFQELQRLFPADTGYVVDSGNGMFLAMEHLRLTQPHCFLGPIDYSCMGYSVPAAIGGQLASPNRQMIALVGDGAFLMTGLELLTAAQMKIPALFIILRDGELSQIAQFQQTTMNRKTATDLPDYDLSAIARGVGVDYLRIDSESELSRGLAESQKILAQKKPVVVELKIDYTYKTHFTRGVLKTNFHRLSFSTKARFLGRAISRRIF